MHHDIGNMKKIVEDNGPKRLHVMMIKEKDDAIAITKASEKEILRANDDLISSKLN